MRGLALCSLFVCALAFVLVYVASNGVGARAPSFAPVNYTSDQFKSQTFAEPVTSTPVVEVERKAASLDASPAMPAPEVRVTRTSRKRRAKPAAKPPAQPSVVVEVPKKAPVIAVAKKSEPKVKAKPDAPALEVPVATPETPPTPTYKPRDVSDAGPVSQLEADREWRRATLAKWRQEAAQKRDGAMSSSRTTYAPGADPNLKGTSVEGLYPPDGHSGDKNKKKKRHRFLFIRW